MMTMMLTATITILEGTQQSAYLHQGKQSTKICFHLFSLPGSKNLWSWHNYWPPSLLWCSCFQLQKFI